MPWAAAGAIGGALIGGYAANSAADKASAGADRATQAQLDMFNTVNNQASPARHAGFNAISDIAQGFGQVDPTEGRGTASGTVDKGYFNHQFDSNDLKAGLAPNYDFMLNQGQTAAKNALNLTGGLGGNFAQGLEKYTQDYAGNAYQQAFTNYTQNQQNIFNRLSTIAGFGNTSNSTVAGSANSLGAGIGNSLTNSGAAQAAGSIGTGNALSSGLNTAGSWYALNNMTKPSAGLVGEAAPGQYSLGNPAYG